MPQLVYLLTPARADILDAATLAKIEVVQAHLQRLAGLTDEGEWQLASRTQDCSPWSGA